MYITLNGLEKHFSSIGFGLTLESLKIMNFPRSSGFGISDFPFVMPFEPGFQITRMTIIIGRIDIVAQNIGIKHILV